MYCFELRFQRGDWYNEQVIFAGSLAGAIVTAYQVSEKGMDIEIWEHQPVIVDGDGKTVPNTHAGGASFGPIFEANHIGKVPTIEEAREHIMFRYTQNWKPMMNWSFA